MERTEWTSLNGSWQFALDPEARWSEPSEVTWDRTIVIPFAPETPASGIDDRGFYRACWYRRAFDAPELSRGQRLLLQFGAVDYAATVWVNGSVAVRHDGGYIPFKADITELLDPTGPQTVVVRAEDDPHDLAKPRGKQDWQAESHGIWYPRTTGIWQTVWLETVPATWLSNVRWTASLERWEVGLAAFLDGELRDDLRLHVELRVGDRVLADDTYLVVAGEVHRRIALSDPGVDDYRNELLWSPFEPTLIRARLELRDGRGELIDVARSYTALRSHEVRGDRFVLNGQPFPLRMVLDQGYWPESGLTPPSDDALRRDVELAKSMGFNGVRKHQKIEDPRYLFWADSLGLLVWQEMPSAYRFTRRSIERVVHEWMEAMHRDFSHPCIVGLVPFNESWGVPDLPATAAQRHYVQAVYHLTKTLNPERPVIGNDGWESVATDIIGIHDYEQDPARIAGRYRTAEAIADLLAREPPAGRRLTVEGHPRRGQPVVLTEFGGIALSQDPETTWGYSRVGTADELAERYSGLLAAVRAQSLLAGFCYTQFADTYQEVNGLLYADRVPKFPLEQIAFATAGPDEASEEDQREWRARLMELQRAEDAAPADASARTSEGRR